MKMTDRQITVKGFTVGKVHIVDQWYLTLVTKHGFKPQVNFWHGTPEIMGVMTRIRRDNWIPNLDSGIRLADVPSDVRYVMEGG